MKYMDDVSVDSFVILHYQGRYLLYSLDNGKPTVSSSFTVKRLTEYLIDIQDAEDDEDRIALIDECVDKATRDGVFGTDKDFKECISLNTVGIDDEPMAYEQFITVYFQKGAKGIYRCEHCNEVVKVSDDVESFAGNGGSLMASAFCFSCS
jgi:hypothetical protein